MTPRILDPHEASVMADHYQDHYREVRGGVGDAMDSPTVDNPRPVDAASPAEGGDE